VLKPVWGRIYLLWKTGKNKEINFVEKMVDNSVIDYLLSIYNAQRVHINISFSDILIYFQRYEVLIKAWNYRWNLVSAGEVENLWKKHLIPSLKPLERDLIPWGAKCLDAGAGAGFPGLPIRFFRRDLVLTLIDSRRKKTLFLQKAREELGLEGLTIIRGRVEEMAERFDVVFSRALGKPEVVTPLLRTRLNPGGKLLLWTARKERVDLLEQEAEEMDIEGGGKLVILGI